MELPDISRRIGTIENRRKIYIEDYVLSYLERFKTEEIDENERIVLYGKSIMELSDQKHIIFGAAKRQKDKTNVKEEVFKEYDEIGCLNLEIWKETSSMYDGVLIGDGTGGQPIVGYYIFYEKEPVMGKYLAIYYEEETRKCMQINKGRKREAESEIKKQAELVVLSEESMVEKILEESPLYSFIRAIVIIIFIIFCAIAVTTVNNFEKMEDFTRTAVQMNESIQQP